MKNTIKFVKAFAKVLRDADLTIADIKAFEGLIPGLGNKLSEMNAWVNTNEVVAETPVITKTITDTPKDDKDDKPWETAGKGTQWYYAYKAGCWVSELGEIFETATGKLLQPYWNNSMYVVDISGREKPTVAAAVVAEAWRITSKDRGALDKSALVPVNGNARDLRPENLKRVPYAAASTDDRYSAYRKIRDNCMMLLKHGGNITAAMNEYPIEMQTEGFRDYLINLRDKRIDVKISDRYFINVAGELSPVDPKAEACEEIEGEDIVSFLNMSKDINITAQLLKNKIGSAKKLTIYEEAIMVSEQTVSRPNMSDPKIRENILAKYGYTISSSSVKKIDEMVANHDMIVAAIRKAIASSTTSTDSKEV